MDGPVSLCCAFPGVWESPRICSRTQKKLGWKDGSLCLRLSRFLFLRMFVHTFFPCKFIHIFPFATFTHLFFLEKFIQFYPWGIIQLSTMKRRKKAKNLLRNRTTLVVLRHSYGLEGKKAARVKSLALGLRKRP